MWEIYFKPIRSECTLVKNKQATRIKIHTANSDVTV